MSKYLIMENGSHVGDIDANSTSQAMQLARNQFPYSQNLTVELDKKIDANPVSLNETRKAIDRMLGRDPNHRI